MKQASTILSLLLIINSSFGSFCEERSTAIKEKVKESDSQSNFKKIRSNQAKLIVFGEAHKEKYLKELPSILPLFIDKEKIKCAFIEQPINLEQSEIDELIKGNHTYHFKAKHSFDYAPFYSFLRDNDIRIIPVDAPYTPPTGIVPFKWMTDRDDVMFSEIMKNLDECERSIFLVGKHHITPDLGGYNVTLGDRLKSELSSEVLFVDIIARKNYYEDYCSYSENNLFNYEETLIDTLGLEKVPYSIFVSHSFYSDFDYIYHPKQ